MSSSPPLVVADRYRLVAPLGQGGMGRVWRATDVVLHRDVAIKELVPPPGLTPDERREMRERSLREARAIARLNNINVVRVFDVLRTDADPWIVMEYVPSRSLQDTLASDGPFPPVRAAEIGLGVLGALRAAHRAGVVHRDVKPGNVLIGEDGRVVLTDFGLATVPGDPNVTRTGLVLGSPAYIAPERARDGTAGPGADLWSLGATLYAAVEGASPFARPSAIATLAALATENPPPARNAGPLKPVLNGLLRKDPTHRINADEAERLLLRAAGRRSKLSFPMSPTMRRPGAGRERPSLPPVGPGSSAAPVVPGPRPPVSPARPPAQPAAESRPVFAPGKASVGRRPAATPTRVDGPKLDATRVDGPPIKDKPVSGTGTAPSSGAQTPEASASGPAPGATMRGSRAAFGSITADEVAAHRKRAAAARAATPEAPPSPATTPSAPAASTPAAATPVTDTPAAAAQVADRPVASTGAADTPVAAAQVADGPVASTQAADTPVADAPAAAAPVAGTAKTDIPGTGTRTPDQRTSSTPASATRAEPAPADGLIAVPAARPGAADQETVGESETAPPSESAASAVAASESAAPATAPSEPAASAVAASESAASATAPSEFATPEGVDSVSDAAWVSAPAEDATAEDSAARHEHGAADPGGLTAESLPVSEPTADAETPAADGGAAVRTAEAGAGSTADGAGTPDAVHAASTAHHVGAASGADTAAAGLRDPGDSVASPPEAGEEATETAQAETEGPQATGPEDTTAVQRSNANKPAVGARPRATGSKASRKKGRGRTTAADAVAASKTGAVTSATDSAAQAATTSAAHGLAETVADPPKPAVEPEPAAPAKTATEAAAAPTAPESTVTEAAAAPESTLTEAAGTPTAPAEAVATPTEVGTAQGETDPAPPAEKPSTAHDKSKNGVTKATTAKVAAARATDRKSTTASLTATKIATAQADTALAGEAETEVGTGAATKSDPTKIDAPNARAGAASEPVSPGSFPVGSTRPAWRPMPVPATGKGLTIFGTTLSRRQTAIGGAVLLAIVLALVLIVSQAFGGGSDNKSHGSKAGVLPAASATGRATTSAPAAAPAPTTTAPTSTAPSPSVPTGTGAVALPPGWHLYADASGYKVPVPANWNVRHQGTETYFQEQGGQYRLLIVDQTTTPAPDPVADWTGKESDRIAGYRDYHRISIKSVDYWDKAADWEFTRTSSSGNPLHVVKRGFITAKNQAYGITWSTSEKDWNANKANLDVIYRDFVPFRS